MRPTSSHRWTGSGEGLTEVYGRKQSSMMSLGNATVQRAQSLDTLTQLGSGHNYHHATCINSRQLTAAGRATSGLRCHKHLVRYSPDVLKHN